MAYRTVEEQMKRKRERIDAQLADRRDYRTALIERRNSIDAKIKATEAQIHQLTEARKAR